jgi:hypothetical protein
MVFAPSGYAASTRSIHEMVGLLDGNYLYVTHRYFAGSQPVPMDYPYLTVEQAAADHHDIVALLKPLYYQVWVSVGSSKSGITCLYHKRFYPDDVDATVAYVAPMLENLADQRVPDYIATLGTSDCRDRLNSFRRAVIRNRDTLASLVESYYQDRGYTAGRFGFEGVVEYEALEFAHAFWQGKDESDCASIPDSTAGPQELFDALLWEGGLSFYSDQVIEYYYAYAYQALAEMGHHAYDLADVQELLTIITNPRMRDFAPPVAIPVFDPTTNADVLSWLGTDGNNIVYIYGANDPWTGCAVELTGSTNALKFVLPGKNHSARILDMADPQPVYDSLEAWMGVSIVLPAQPSPQGVEPDEYRYVPVDIAQQYSRPTQSW